MAQNAFEYFMGQKNARCVDLLNRNHDVSGFVQALLELLVNYSEEKGVPFERITFVNPTVGNDGDIHALIRTR